MMVNVASTEQVRFRPKARLVDTIGGDLIRDEMAGVIELVKNAYDADATAVRLSFRDLTNQGVLSIEDDGHGMSKETLIEHWMSPATGVKGERGGRSPYGRPMLGRKGVGRFSAMRLGNHLALETKPGDDAPGVRKDELKHTYRLLVDWDRFREGDPYLEDVFLELATLHHQDASSHWTRLEISDLQDEWNEVRLRRLVSELKLLLSPTSVDETSRFQIRLDLTSSGLPEAIIKRIPSNVEPHRLPDVADYIVKATVKADGKCFVNFVRTLMREDDPDEQEFSRVEADIRKLFPEEYDDVASIDPLPCGPFELELTMWDRDREVLERKGSRLGEIAQMGVRAQRRFFDEISGAAIYRDDFRVRQDEADWLGLAQRRVQNPTQRLGPNQLFVLVRISTLTNPSLEDKSSREGLKENEAYRALRASIIAVLGLVEPIRVRFRRRHSIGRAAPKSTRALREARTQAIATLRKAIDRELPKGSARTQITRLAASVDQTIEQEHERLNEEAELMHDTQALGLLARFIIHEGRNLDGTLDSAITNLERCVQAGRQAQEHDSKVVLEGSNLENLLSSLAACRESELRLEALLDQLDPLTRPRRGRRPKVVVEEILQRVHRILSADLGRARVAVQIPLKKHMVLAWEADLFHAFFNLMHNSLYWVQKRSGDRFIKVEVRKGDAKRLDVTMADSGPGVPVGSAETIFDLGYSEKPDGLGLGLFIAKEGIERSRGTIEIVNPGETGAMFRVSLETQ